MDIVHAIAIDGVDYEESRMAPAAPQSARALRLPLRSSGGGPPAHLPTWYRCEKKDGIARVLRDMKAGGIDNVPPCAVIVLRGWTSCRNRTHPHASDLVRFIKETGISAWAALPILRDILNRGPLMEDLENMKRKVDAGCDFLVTQMFFDNEMFYNFMYRLLAKRGPCPCCGRRHADHERKAGGTHLYPQRNTHSQQAAGRGGALW